MHATIERLIAAKRDMPGALLPILHDIQDTVGYVPPDCVERIAQSLNMSRAEVHGVITFYHHFRTAPAGRHVIQICRAEACKSMGSDALWQHACRRLQVNPHDAEHGATTSDNAITLQPVYCLGLCATSPAVAVDDRVHARVDHASLDRIVSTARSAA